MAVSTRVCCIGLKAIPSKWYDTHFARARASAVQGPESLMTGTVLVTGASGRLAAFVAAAFGDGPVTALTRAELDITDPVAVRRAVADLHPAVVVNCASYNNVDGAEDAPAEALGINATGVRSLARAAEACGAALVHYSTDFVYSGDGTEPYVEADAPSPRSNYAASKLLGEWFVLNAPRSYVLRVESLFGCGADWAGPKSTLDAMVEAMRALREVRVFTDRVVSPSYMPDVARATRHLVDSQAEPGLYHCVNSGHASWKDVAVEAARVLGVTPQLVEMTTAQVTFRASRPTYCALSNRKLAQAGFEMPTWRDALRRWIGDASAASA